MAVKPQIKANQLAKDLGIKSKEIVDIMSEKGIELKAQKSLEPREFNILFDALTSAYQIDGIDDYIDGVTTIPSKLEKKAPEAEKVAKETEEKADEKQNKNEKAPAVEAKKAEAAPAPEKKAEEKSANTEKAVAEKKETVAAKTETKAHAAENKQSAPAAEKKPAPAPAQEKKPAPAAPAVKVQPKVDRAEAIARAAAIEKAAREKAASRGEGAPRQDNRASVNNNANNRRENNQFAPRQDGGQRNNSFANNNGTRLQSQGQGQSGDRFSRMGAPNFDRQASPQRRDDRKPQKPQFNNNNRGGAGMDKDDFVQSAPREKFQPQIITRAQTPKGGDGTSKKGAAKTVDIRSSNVDLSKYDEKLDSFVSENERDLRNGNNQKLKKQQNQNRAEGGFGKGGKNNKKGAKGEQKAPITIVKGPLKVQIPEEIMVSDLASMLKVTVGEVIKKLMLLGAMATANQTIDFDTAALVAVECGAEPEKAVVVTIEEKLFDESEDTAEQLEPRAPVVCVMGHVDHGKTSLLDAIRHTNVTTGEAGGITQHIGAYRVKINGQDITFLDTPGHEAFTSMRLRGAMVTDIAILVVAADDGIMPQTVEAINHAKAAGVSIIVAINKMDKESANPERIKQQLTEHDLVVEDWGGDVIAIPVSAKTGMGFDDLLENILLVAEIKELKANPNRLAKGSVIEARLDKGRGPVATILVQNGTLRSGDVIIAGTSVGRVRTMTDDKGRLVKEAGPSVPVEITGLAEVPSAGDIFNAVADEKLARELVEQRKHEAKEEIFKQYQKVTLDNLFSQISEGEMKELPIIVKADVQGSVEAVRQSLEKISNEEVRVKVIHGAVGAINESDVMLANASNALIVGFNVRPDPVAKANAERDGVDMRMYRVIYDAIEEIQTAMKGMLAPKFREVETARVEIRQVYKISGVGSVAGCYVQDGKISRNDNVRVVRDGIIIADDKMSSLKRFKDNVKEVAQGFECGITLEKFNDFKEGDIFEAYTMSEIPQ